MRVFPDVGIGPATRFVVQHEQTGKGRLKDLFAGSLKLTTPLLWLSYFFESFTYLGYTAWLTTIMEAHGATQQQAAFAFSYAGMGGIVVLLSLSRLLDRFGPLASFGSATDRWSWGCCRSARRASPSPPIWSWRVVAHACGAGTHNSLNSTVAMFYPTRIRSNGVGWATAAGRIGGAVGPLTIGYAFAAKLPLDTVLTDHRGAVSCRDGAQRRARHDLSSAFHRSAGTRRRGVSTMNEATKPEDWRRIDVHHHIAPKAYLEAVGANVGPVLRHWSLAKAIADMDEGEVATALLSVTQTTLDPGKEEQARGLALDCNDYAARIVSDHRGRFGMFTALPMPDIDGSLRVIEYGMDVLKADGVGLYTSYRDKWLGDASFDPVFEELDRRKAVIYVHPISPDCCTNLRARPAGCEYRIRHRHHARHRQYGVHRRVAALSQSAHDLVACRRHYALPDRALHAHRDLP